MNKLETLTFNAIPEPLIKHDELEEKRSNCRINFSEEMNRRVRRAISWLGRAEQLSQGDQHDPDMQFICLWIGLNAACANSETLTANFEYDERNLFEMFFQNILNCDERAVVSQAIQKKLSLLIEKIIENKFLYYEYWKFHNGNSKANDWENKFSKNKHQFKVAREKKQHGAVLRELFNRFYVLRNQLMHGGSTWNRGTNRIQLEHCVQVLGYLLPLFINVMLEHPKVDWGKPFYPVMPK